MAIDDEHSKTWEEHLKALRYESMENQCIEEDDREVEAVRRAIREEERRKNEGVRKLHAKKRLQENEARLKDFGLQMLTINESPGKDHITLRLQAQVCMRAIVLIQSWIRGTLVRNMMKRIELEHERSARILEAQEIESGGGWKEARDRDGRPYYWNRISGCTTFAEPAIYENLAGMIVEKESNGGRTRRFSQYASQWQTAIAESGRRYYFDTITGARSWQKPPGWGTRGVVSPAQERLERAKSRNVELKRRIREMQEEVRILESGVLDMGALADAVGEMH